MRVQIASQLTRVTVERVTSQAGECQEMHLETSTLKCLTKETAGDFHLQAQARNLDALSTPELRPIDKALKMGDEAKGCRH